MYISKRIGSNPEEVRTMRRYQFSTKIQCVPNLLDQGAQVNLTSWTGARCQQ